MRRVPVAQLPAGVQMAQSLQDARGGPLLSAGVTLTPRLAQLLQARGARTVLVWSELDVAAAAAGPDPRPLQPPGELLSEEVRRDVVEAVSATFEAISQAARDPHLAGRPPDVVVAALTAPSQRPLLDATLAARLHRAADALADAAAASITLPGWTSLKTAENYHAFHGLDTAIAAVVLGRHAGLIRDHLRQLALGCLVHDVGEAVLGPDGQAALRKPGRLTEREWELVRQHPATGLSLLRQLPERDVLARTAAVQHHERQDGSGYPRRLTGSNKVARDLRAAEPGRMSLVGEIATVADIYDALSSDRPHRLALRPDQVAVTLRQLAGAHLNAELVDLFLRALPPFPEGMEVTVAGGEYGGYRGVVWSVPRQETERPVVRLVRDAGGQPVTPVDLDLRAEPTIELAAAE